jgi:nitroreductase
MQALDLLLNRRSQPRLQAPAPNGEALHNIIQAALCAPDHKCLAPWRFVICTNEGLEKLGNIFSQAAINKEAELATIERAPQLPMRAPMVIVAICNYTFHEKVPRVEQIASTACAVQAMQMAAVAQGFQGIWRTGWYAQNEDVKKALGCKEEDEILGFLYLGTTPLKASHRKSRDIAPFVETWN